MSNIKKARVKIVGTRPLLFHRFKVDILEKTGRKEKAGSAGNNPEEWRETFFADGEGHLFLPSIYLFSSLRDGSKYVKEGKGSISKKVAATLQVMDDIVYLNRWMPKGYETIATADFTQNPMDEVFLHVCGVVNPSTKGRNVRYRVACSPGWEAEFEILWDSSIVSQAQIKDVLDSTGTLTGLADGRGIGYGRFEVAEFNVLK